jgi:membrane-anchored protein YejM (alkaline phosphatase superfamily)
LDRFGKYRIYDLDYKKRLDKKMSAPELIQVMREGRRLYNQ